MACRVNLRKIETSSNEKIEKEQKTFWQKTLFKADLLLEQSLALAQEDGFAIKNFFEGASKGAEKATRSAANCPLCREIITLIRSAFPRSYAPFGQILNVPAAWQRVAKSRTHDTNCLNKTLEDYTKNIGAEQVF